MHQAHKPVKPNLPVHGHYEASAFQTKFEAYCLDLNQANSSQKSEWLLNMSNYILKMTTSKRDKSNVTSLTHVDWFWKQESFEEASTFLPEVVEEELYTWKDADHLYWG